MGSPMGPQHSWPPSGPQPNMGYNGGTMVQPGPPQKMLRPQQVGGGRPYFNDGGPPPNTWVGGPNDPKIMMGGGPPGGPGQNPAYYRNNMCQPRPPMMRPQVGIPNHYGAGDFAPNGTPTNAGGQPMYGQMRNNYMTTNGGGAATAGDPYGNNRFASPASVATNGVCPPAMYSPNAAPPDSMMSRMTNGNNFTDNPAAAANNGSYNNFNDFNGYTNRVRPNFINPNAGGQQPQQQPQMMPTFNGGGGGRGGPLNQSSPMYHGGNNIQPQQQGFNTNYNVNNMDQLQQQQQQHHQQQQQQQQQQSQLQQQGLHQPNPNSMMSNGVNGPGGPANGSSEFDYPNGVVGMMENNNEVMEWKLKSNDIRQSLLAKLKEALMGQEYPNAEAMANQFELRAFNESNSINDYQMKLARSLASIFENSASATSITNNHQNPSSQFSINSPPDSSTNDQISDVTTSSSGSGNNDNVITGNGVGVGGNGNNDSKNSALEDLLTGQQPPSASPSSAVASASPIGVPGGASTSIAVSPVSSAASSIAITSGSAPSTLTTTATSSSLPTTGTSSTTSTSNSTFQHPAMPASSQHSTDPSSAAVSNATNEKSLNGVGGPLPSVVVPNIVASNRVGGGPPPLPGSQPPQQRRISGSGALSTAASVTTSLPVSSISNNPQSVDSGIGLGSPRSITSASSTTLYSPKIQGTSPSLIPGSDNSPEKASSS